MPRSRFYPVAIELDGRKYTGEWALIQGGDLCVRSRWGNDPRAPVGRRKPELVAAEVLRQIVVAWQKKRERDARQIERETLRVARTGRARGSRRKVE